jgi:hypothetical protein
VGTIIRLGERLGAVVRDLPALLVWGFGVLALGLLLDLAIHLSGGASGAHGGHSGAALAVHGVVFAGMFLSLAGLVQAAVTAGRRPRPAVHDTTRRFDR